MVSRKSPRWQPGDTTTVTFTLIEKTALFKGGAWDKRADVSVDVDGHVWASRSAYDGSLHTATDLKAGGYFTLPVPAGLWRLNYAIDPEANYLKAGGPRSYGMQDGQTQIVPLPVLRKDATLSGTVVLTDGVTPARGAVVIAEGLSPEVNGLTLRAPVRDDGSFSMQSAVRVVQRPIGPYPRSRLDQPRRKGRVRAAQWIGQRAAALSRAECADHGHGNASEWRVRSPGSSPCTPSAATMATTRRSRR